MISQTLSGFSRSGLRIFSRSFSTTWFTLQKRGLLRPMQLLRAFVHWDHDSRPTAPVFAGVIHSCQSRQYFAVTSGLENDNRRPHPVLAGIQQARASYENS